MTPRQRYPTDLTDAQWAVLEPLIPAAKPGGRPRSADLRAIVDAILYHVRNGGTWRSLPHDYPPWKTVYHYCPGLAPGRDLGAHPRRTARPDPCRGGDGTRARARPSSTASR